MADSLPDTTGDADDKRQARLTRVALLAAELDLAMAQRVLTQAQLARLVDTDRATVNKMLKGKDGMVSTWLAAFDAAGFAVIIQRKDVA